MMCTVSTNILHIYFSELGFSSSLPQTKPLEASRPLISSLNREPCSCKDGVSCICFVLVFIDSYIVFKLIDSCSATMLASKFMTAHKFVV